MRVCGALRASLRAARLRRVLPGWRVPGFQAMESAASNKKAVDRKSTACCVFGLSALTSLVPRRGLEPPRCYSLVPETSASTNSAIWASQEAFDYRPSNARLCARRVKSVKFFERPGEDQKKAEDMRSSAFSGFCLFKMVPRRGLEPPRCYSLVPETSASTNSAIWASQEFKDCILKK